MKCQNCDKEAGPTGLCGDCFLNRDPSNGSIFRPDIEISEGKEPIPVVVVRVKTSYWCDKRGVHFRKDLEYLQRQCKHFNFLDDDARMIGAEDVIPRIVNLHEVKDGVYQVITINESGSDWENPGCIDEWDYKLIPYENKTTTHKAPTTQP
jgi:hypothetical protein